MPIDEMLDLPPLPRRGESSGDALQRELALARLMEAINHHGGERRSADAPSAGPVSRRAALRRARSRQSVRATVGPTE